MNTVQTQIAELTRTFTIVSCLLFAACGTGTAGAARVDAETQQSGLATVIDCSADVVVNPNIAASKERYVYRLGIERNGDKFVTARFNGSAMSTFYAAGDTTSEAQTSEVANDRLTAYMPDGKTLIVRCTTSSSCGNSVYYGITGVTIPCTTTQY